MSEDKKAELVRKTGEFQEKYQLAVRERDAGMMFEVVQMMNPTLTSPDAVGVMRGVALISAEYGLDPLLKEVAVIVFQGKPQLYIGRDGWRRIADRSKIPWGFRAGTPRKKEYPYGKEGEEDVWLEGSLERQGYPTQHAGLFLREVMPLTKEGKPMATWMKMPHRQHMKTLEKHLLQGSFRPTLPWEVQAAMADSKVVVVENDDLQLPAEGEIVDSTGVEVEPEDVDIPDLAFKAQRIIQTRAADLHKQGEAGDLAEESDLRAWVELNVGPLVANELGALSLVVFRLTGLTLDKLDRQTATALVEWWRDEVGGGVAAEIVQHLKDNEPEKKVTKEEADQAKLDLFGEDPAPSSPKAEQPETLKAWLQQEAENWKENKGQLSEGRIGVVKSLLEGMSRTPEDKDQARLERLLCLEYLFDKDLSDGSAPIQAHEWLAVTTWLAPKMSEQEAENGKTSKNYRVTRMTAMAEFQAIVDLMMAREMST
jgi:hypothetical protein